MNEPLPSFGVIDRGVWLQTVDHHGPGHDYFSVPQPWSNCRASILSIVRLFATQSGLLLRKMYRLALHALPSSPLGLKAPKRLAGPRRKAEGAWRGTNCRNLHARRHGRAAGSRQHHFACLRSLPFEMRNGAVVAGTKVSAYVRGGAMNRHRLDHDHPGAADGAFGLIGDVLVTRHAVPGHVCLMRPEDDPVAQAVSA